MSLVAGYSSDEDDLGPATITEDAFGLSNLPVSKKPRTEEIVSRQTLQAAPDVLAEVSRGLSEEAGCARPSHPGHRRERLVRRVRTVSASDR